MGNKAAAGQSVMQTLRFCRQMHIKSLFEGWEMLFIDCDDDCFWFTSSLFCVGRVPVQRWCTVLLSVHAEFPAGTFLYYFPEFPAQQEESLCLSNCNRESVEMVIPSAPYSSQVPTAFQYKHFLKSRLLRFYFCIVL